MKSTLIARLRDGLILDGGLATRLEDHGYDLKDPLWSGRILIDHPNAIAAVHEEYLLAGAECITTASYQLSMPGLHRAGLTDVESAMIFKRSVELAHEACRRHPTRSPLVAASVGPFGASLADGSEFRGDDGLTVDQLYEFHSARLDFLTAAQPDLLACETIPSVREVRALTRWLSAASIPAWISLCCRDDEQTCAGDPIEEAARAVEDVDAVVAIGINCTAPAHLLGLVERLSAVTQKAIIVYPNAGQTWNAITRRWEGPRDIDGWTTYCQEWWKAGARLIGGCCQTTPGHIRRLADEMNHARGLT